MKFSTVGLSTNHYETERLSTGQKSSHCYRNNVTRNRRKRRDTSSNCNCNCNRSWTKLVIWLALTCCAPSLLTTTQETLWTEARHQEEVEDEEEAAAAASHDGKQHGGLDDEAQEQFNAFLEELNDFTYVQDLIKESNQRRLPDNHNRALPVMIGRRRSLLEHNIHRHYSLSYLMTLQDEVAERQDKSTSSQGGANADETSTNTHKNHPSPSQQSPSAKDKKRLLQDVIQALVYQTPVDAHTKANPQRHRHNAATSNHLGLPPFPPSLRQANAKLVKDMFYRTYKAYMKYSFPASELLPITCQPGTFDLIRLPCLTLIDALDTLLVLGDSLEFAKSVERLREFDRSHRNTDGTGGIFAVNQNVSVFETTIRVLGGLQSAHQMALAFLERRQNKLQSRDHNRSQLPPVLLREVFDDPGDRYLVPLEEDLQILRDHQQECAVVDSFQPHKAGLGMDGSCSVSGDSGRTPGEIRTPETTTANNHNANFQSNDWEKQHCAAGLVSLEDCAAKGAPRFVNRTAEALLRKQRLDREPLWGYDGFLLELAIDIGERLLPAFATRTGIPFGTVNLMQGVPSGETTIASLAGGGTLSLEFELLSRLSGDLRFGQAAKLAVRALWLRRSSIDLVGKHIDVQRGVWTETLSGIGSNSDSFLEYLLKHYLLFPEDGDFWVMLQSAYSGVFHDSRLGEWYADVDMNKGLQSFPKGLAKRVLESLMAFYPGLQTLMGEVAPAARSMNSFFMVREHLGFLPERFSYASWAVDGGMSSGAASYPLRPELLESCYFMHRATKKETDSSETSSSWQWAADFALHHLERLTRSRCGYASVRGLNSATGNLNMYRHPGLVRLDDDMPSFFLSETLKYLYLTFDDDNVLHSDKDHEWIFTTEAHPIHFVPTYEKQKETIPKSQIESDSPRLAAVKNYLRDKLLRLKQDNEGRPLDTSKKQSKASDVVSAMYLMDELWSDSTEPRKYRESILSVFEKIDHHAKSNSSASEFSQHSLKSFFGPEESLLDSVPLLGDTHIFKEDNNLAHIVWNSIGLGNGYSMKKACANFYAPELTWVNALSGGVLDYTDTYVSAYSEANSDYPTSADSLQLLLSSAEALSLHGSGVYLGKVNFDANPGDICRVPHSQTRQTLSDSQAAKNKSPPPLLDEAKTVIQQVHLAGVGTFDVSAFPEGSGFFMQLKQTAESLMVTFISDTSGENVNHEMAIMVYASMPRRNSIAQPEEADMQGVNEAGELPKGSLDHFSTTKAEGNVSRLPWKKFVGPRWAEWFKNRKNQPKLDNSDEMVDLGPPERAVVYSDLNQNAFHCKVNIIRRTLSAIGGVESKNVLGDDDELLSTFPCAPALFGPSRMERLIESNGLFLERAIIAPDTANEFGCASDDDNFTPSVTTTSKNSDFQMVPVELDDAAGDFIIEEHDDAFRENKTIQLVQRGKCSFFEKSVNQKNNADGVIVINTEDTELFVMSHGVDEKEGEQGADMPVSVLVTGLDGEKIVSLIQLESEQVDNDNNDEKDGAGSHLLAQIYIFSQAVEFDAQEEITSDHRNVVWPVVRGSDTAVQVFAQGGWGIHTVRKDGGSIQESATAGDLQLFLLRHANPEEEEDDKKGAAEGDSSSTPAE